MIWFRKRVRTDAGICFIVVFALLVGIVLWRVGCVGGYVADRHVLILVLCGTFPAAALLQEVAHGLAAWFTARSFKVRPIVQPAAVTAICVALPLSLCVPKALEPLHFTQKAHKEAGLWLSRHAAESDAILDPFEWATFYAGRVVPQPLENPAAPCEYVVIEATKMHHSPHVKKWKRALEHAETGELVFQCKPLRGQEVKVFRVRRGGVQ